MKKFGRWHANIVSIDVQPRTLWLDTCGISMNGIQGLIAECATLGLCGELCSKSITGKQHPYVCVLNNSSIRWNSIRLIEFEENNVYEY